MYGKSYDALTGLIGVNKRPAGLGAVVAQEPVYDDYRYLYGGGTWRENLHGNHSRRSRRPAGQLPARTALRCPRTS